MTSSATDAARDLAAVLQAQAEALASDELATVAPAMTAVRAAARALEESLVARGWGGEVLYGFGDPLDDEDDEDGPAGLGDDLSEDLEDADLDEDDDEDHDEPWRAPEGERVTYQARFDFVVTDEDALRAYVQQRIAGPGDRALQEDLEQAGPFYVLTSLDGLASKDYAEAGLVFAGAQESVREVPVTLWELGHDLQDDEFPLSS